MVPDIAAYERSAHTRLSSWRRAWWNQCHVLFVDRAPFSLSFLAIFYINRKPYFSALISKRKFGRARGGEKKYRNCVTVKYIKCKSEGLRKKNETVRKVLAPDIFPVLLQGWICFLHVLYLSFWVRKNFFILLSVTFLFCFFLLSKPIWNNFRCFLLSYVLFFIVQRCHVDISLHYKCTHY